MASAVPARRDHRNRLAQYLQVGTGQHWTRRDTELGIQAPPQVLEQGQRGGLLPDAGQRGHQQCMRLLVQRLAGRQLP